MSNCSVSYSSTLIQIILAIASADIIASLLQFGAAAAIMVELNQEVEEGEAYKVVSNLTNNTV
jgi:hypothetical protein